MNKLNENLRIEFNYKEEQAVMEDTSKLVKFLINLYDGESKEYDTKDPESEKIIFR